MNLVDFLGWEDSNGIYRGREDSNGMYRSQVYGELYRVVNNRLETFVPEISEWRESNIRINKLDELQPMKQVGMWTEGFEIHNEEEWELVKTYYLQKGYDVLEITMFAVKEFIKNGTVFYAWPYYGRLGVTTDKNVAKRDLVLKPIVRK